ncbi:MAG: hypothetical protein ACU841_04805 [Gammaproteobacteria bacterium]
MKNSIQRLPYGLALAIDLFNPAPYAEELTCTGSVGAITVENLKVPDGATCTLDKTFVDGTIKV